jgi:hypothetical protein
MSRKTATVDSFSLKPLLMLRSILTRWSVVHRDFLKPAYSGSSRFLVSTNRFRRCVRRRSNSLPRHEVKLMGR